MTARQEDRICVLVGWTARTVEERVILRLQNVHDLPRSPDEIETVRYLMSPNQAVQLANTLYQLTANRPPPPRAGWLRRLFGP